MKLEQLDAGSAISFVDVPDQLKEMAEMAELTALLPFEQITVSL